MKGIAAIFTLYIFVLVLMPCFDDPYHQAGTTTDIESIFDGSHSELCSPFCSDHDCHTHITISFVTVDFSLEQFCENHVVENPQEIAKPYFDIWQPPKIS